MSNIAEKIHNVALQKAEEYSKTHGNTIIEEVAYGRGYKTAYIECYDQAMKDFLEKAEEYLRKEFVDMWLRYIRGHSMDDEIKMFKNYMQDESEN